MVRFDSRVEEIVRNLASVSIDLQTPLDQGLLRMECARAEALARSEAAQEHHLYLLRLEDRDDRSIVESVIHMARAFNRNVVAEGVETMDHARALLEMGCFQVQGYGIGRPMPADALPGWIQEWRQQRSWEALGEV